QGFEGRTHFINASGQTVKMVWVIGFAWVVWIKVRHGHDRNDLAGVDVGNQASGGLGLVLFARINELVTQRILYAQVDCKFDRPLQWVGRETCHMQCGETLSIQPLFNSGDTLVVDIHMANLMRDHRSIGIDALVLRKEADAWYPESVNFQLLAWRNLALEPHK